MPPLNNEFESNVPPETWKESMGKQVHPLGKEVLTQAMQCAHSILLDMELHTLRYQLLENM